MVLSCKVQNLYRYANFIFSYKLWWLILTQFLQIYLELLFDPLLPNQLLLIVAGVTIVGPLIIWQHALSDILMCHLLSIKQ